MKKFLSIILALILVFSCFSVIGFSAVAEDTAPITYNAVDGYSTENNPSGNWSYETKTASGYVPMTYAKDTWSASSARIATAIGDKVTTNTDTVMALGCDGQTNDASLAFTAPYTGTVTVSMANGGVFSPAQGSDAVTFKMLHNDKTVKSVSDLDNSYNAKDSRFFTDSVSLTVKKGDKIRFNVHRNAAVGGSTTYLNPKITYTNIFKTKYNAADDFSTENNPSGNWSYEAKVGTTYNAMTYANNTWSANSARIVTNAGDKVTTNVDTVMMLAADGQVNEASLTFTAPFTGTVNVKMANGGVFSPTQGSDAARFSMLYNEETVKSVSDLDNAYNAAGSRFFTDTVTLNVSAGDKIRFNVGRNIAASAPVYFNPEIEYTEAYIGRFNAVESFSTTNNPNEQWGYETKVGTDYFPMTYQTSNWGGNSARIYTNTGDAVTTDADTVMALVADGVSNEASLVFTAPYSGTVTVKMENGGVFSPQQSNHEARFTMLLNDDVIKSVSDLDSGYNAKGNRFFTDTVTLDVTEGDKIRFNVGRNHNVGGTNTYFNPTVTYLSVADSEGYYISNSEGNDANSGTDRNHPWKSFANIASTTFAPGDKIYLKSGDTWNEQLVLNNIEATKDEPIVVSSYGGVAKPVIDLGLTDNGSTPAFETAVPCVKATNAEGLEIKNLSLTGSGIGIDLSYENDFNNEYVKISDCLFTNLNGFNQLDYRGGNTGKYYIAGAVCVTEYNYNIACDDPALIGLYIDNCVSDNCGTLYTSGKSTDTGNEAFSNAVHGLYVTNTTMRNNDYYGSIIIGVQGGYMNNCVIDNCGDAANFEPGTAGLMISAKDYAVVNCEIKNQKTGGQLWDAVAIDLEHSCENVVIKNNYIHDNAGAGMLIYDSKKGADGVNTNCEISNNVFSNNAQTVTPICDIRIEYLSDCSLTNSTIANNKYFTNKGDSYDFIKYACNKISTSEPSGTNNTITDNTVMSAADESTYLLDKSTVLSAVKTEFDNYNESGYTVDEAIGKTNLNASVATDTYKFKDGFHNNTSPWEYKYHDESDAVGIWRDMEWDSTNNRYSYGVSGMIGSDFVHPNNTGTLAIAFKAPKSGRIAISLDQFKCKNTTQDGTQLVVLDNGLNQIAAPITLDVSKQTADFGVVYVDVKKDEYIYFCVSKRMNPNSDTTYIEPVIEYVNTFASLIGNSELDIRDIVALKKQIVNSNYSFDADINGDSKLDADDITLLVSYLLGIIVMK